MADGADTVRGWGRDVSQFASAWAGVGAEVVAAELRSSLGAATGGDRRLSNLSGGAGDVDVIAGNGEAEVVGSGNRGLWTILESGTTGHFIRSRRARGLIRTPYGPRHFAQVRGVEGQATWSEGLENAEPRWLSEGERKWMEATR